MGIEKKCYGLTHNILLQLMTFYCYDELKIIVFTSEEKARKWDYLKYSNYCFNTEKNVRFFATNIEEAKELSSYLMQELNMTLEEAADFIYWNDSFKFENSDLEINGEKIAKIGANKRFCRYAQAVSIIYFHRKQKDRKKGYRTLSVWRRLY